MTVGDKLRFRFRKADALRLVSHHDLMRCAERMCRRAGVPFKSTQGFHPAPRIVFAQSLPLGVVGCDEVVEIELTEPRDPADTLTQLAAQAPPGLTFTSVKAVPMKAGAVPRRAVYRIPVPAGRDAEVAATAAALLAEPKVWVDRVKPHPRRVNIRPYLRGIAVAGGHADVDLWVTGGGTARADELVHLLGLADAIDRGGVVERIALEVHDEATPTADEPPTGPPETAPLAHAPAAAGGETDLDARRPAWGLSPNGPVVE